MKGKKVSSIMGIVVVLMLIATLAYAAGVCVDTYKDWGQAANGTKVTRLRWTCTGGTGTWADTTNRELHGYVVMGITDPANTMTDNYDISITDANGVDVFGDGQGGNNQLLNRDTTTSEAEVPYMGARRVDGTLSMSLSGNSNTGVTVITDIFIAE